MALGVAAFNYLNATHAIRLRSKYKIRENAQILIHRSQKM